MAYLRKPSLTLGYSAELSLNPAKLFELNPIQIMSQQTNLSWLINFDENLIRKFALIMPSTMYSINKVYNSDKYYILGEGGIGEEKLDTTIVQNQRAKTIYAINEKTKMIDLTEWETIFSDLGDGKIFEYDPIQLLSIQQQQSETRIQNFIQSCLEQIEEIKTQIQNTIDSGVDTLKRKLRSLQTKLNTAQKTQSQTLPTNAKFAGAIVPIAVSGTMTTITAITSLILNKFLLVGSAIALGEAIKAFAWTASSMVIKMLKGTGADICRYLAGGFLKGIENLPLIFERTGLFTGTYNYLMAYAPYILIAAILTYKLIKEQELLLGDYLYVYGKNNSTGVTAFGTAFLSNFDRNEMITTLISLGIEVQNESSQGYDILRGIALEDNDENKIAVLVDFNDDNKIYRNKAHIQRLATGDLNIPEVVKNFSLF